MQIPLVPYALSVSCSDKAILRTLSESVNFGQPIITCLIDRLTLRLSRIGFISLVMRYERVRWEWPILAQVITTPLLVMPGEYFHFLISDFTFPSLFDRPMLYRLICQVSTFSFLILSIASEVVIEFIFINYWDVTPSFASKSTST